MQNIALLMNNSPIKKDTSEKDLGITFDTKLKFSPHIRNIVSKANSRVGIIRHNFTNLSPTVFLPLYKALVRPLLEYGSVIWYPSLISDNQEIEKVQRRATKLVTGLKNLPYSDRLKILNLDSMLFRRRRNDMLQTFRIMKDIDNLSINNFFTINTNSITRGHEYKIVKPRANANIRLQTFSNRVINDWNNLNNTTVMCNTLNSFKTALKKEWRNHPNKYLESE